MKKEMLAISISLLVSLVFTSGCMEETPPVEKLKTVYVDDDGGANFTKIQDAIDHVVDGGTIFVRNGTYYETLLIDKSINLIGTDKNKTIIEYNQRKPGLLGVININADNCTIEGFTIKISGNISDHGIYIKSSNNTISNNMILNILEGITSFGDVYNNKIIWNTISNNGKGIDLGYSKNNTISNNSLISNTDYGIVIRSFCNYNIISNNIFSNNNYSLWVKGKNNMIFRNTFVSNKIGIYLCCGGRDNLIYYNKFENNHNMSAFDSQNNQWDYGEIGNYWDDYAEKHPDAIQIDSIWDTPYKIIGGGNIDRFPLASPIDI